MRMLTYLSILLFSTIATVQVAHAELMYEYTGNPFTIVSGSITVDQFLTGTVSFDPVPTFPSSGVMASSFSLSLSGPGLNFTITDTTPGIVVNDKSFNFDSLGNITDWNLDIEAKVSGIAELFEELTTNELEDIAVVDVVSSQQGGSSAGADVKVIFPPPAPPPDPPFAQWRRVASTQPVPEPASLIVWLALLGVCGSVFVWRRRRTPKSGLADS